MVACTACGKELPGEFPFCPFCGAPLGGPVVARPVNGVAVGVATFEATGVVFDYTELERATLKGKAEPVRVFQALASRARLGSDLTRTHDSPFVGREIDLALLKGLFDKTVAASSSSC